MRTLIFPSFKNSNPKSKKKTTKKESTLEIVGYQCGSDRTMAKIQMKPKLKKEEEQAQVSTVLSSFVSRLIVLDLQDLVRVMKKGMVRKSSEKLLEIRTRQQTRQRRKITAKKIPSIKI